MSRRAFIGGLQASTPIVIGYLPVALAFGIASHLGVFTTVLISVSVFAGASQFALIGLLASGTPLMGAALVALGLNIRHLLYGMTLAPRINDFSLRERLAIAFGLTDEVFATAFSRMENIPTESRLWWLIGLEFGAYASWVGGTWAGSAGGSVLLQYFGFLKPALSFALPALFLSLLLSLLLPGIRGATLLAVLTSLIIATCFQWAGHTALGILVAAITGPAVGILREN